MPQVQIGKGVDAFNGKAHQNSIFVNLQEKLNSDDNNVTLTTDHTLSTKLVSSFSVLKDELTASLGISGHVYGINGSAEANFINEIKANSFDIFYVINLTQELYTEVLPAGLKISSDVLNFGKDFNVKKIDFLKLMEFHEKYGGSCVDKIVYGKKIIFVAQLKQSSVHELKNSGGKLDIDLPIGNISGKADFKKVHQALTSDKFSQIYFYVSGTQDPYPTLTQQFDEISKIISKITKDEQPDDADSQAQSPETKPSNNEGAVSSKEELQGDALTKPTQRKHKSRHSGTLSATTSSKKSSSHDPKATSSQEPVKNGNPSSTTSEINDSDDKVPPKLAIKKLAQLRYDSSPFTTWLPLTKFNYFFRENLDDTRTMLERIKQAKVKLKAYQDLLSVAFEHADKLAFNSIRRAELERLANLLERIQTRIKINEDFFTREWFLLYKPDHVEDYDASIRINKFNKSVIEILNSLDSDLIKFNNSLLLLAERNAEFSTYFANAKHAHRNTHYFNVSLFPEVSKIFFEFRILNQGNFAPLTPQDISVNLKLRRPLSGKMIHKRIPHPVAI